MQTIASGTTLLDVEFLGYRESIAPCLLEGHGEVVLIDCGPASCLPTLGRELAAHGLTTRDLSALLLTHIHLDHAGAAGSLLADNPRLPVYVHEKGAPHLAAPEKLLRSAERLYGDALQQIFGPVLPVPPQNLRVLGGGERLEIAGRSVEVAYTPGHAVHHLSYFDQTTGLAFVGDTTGLRLPRFGLLAPVTPPPDIDLESWRSSLQEIARRRPTQLFLTHFGPFADVDQHVNSAWEAIERWARRAQGILASQLAEERRAAEFEVMAESEFRAHLTPQQARHYALMANPRLSWLGLARYWAKKSSAVA
jgi:glyoxylase-like metal-dependent hydrolase (beta-lactamase superfamily II)